MNNLIIKYKTIRKISLMPKKIFIAGDPANHKILMVNCGQKYLRTFEEFVSILYSNKKVSGINVFIEYYYVRNFFTNRTIL